MTRHLHTCGHVHDCSAPDPAEAATSAPDSRTVAVLMSHGWDEQRARETALGWYDDEDRLGYEEGHQCCPDCGCDPDDHTCHADGCPRVFPIGHPDEALQFGPPWTEVSR